ncbi:hypothetical protein ACFLZY_00540 [Patescibacteria group bacterium]
MEVNKFTRLRCSIAGSDPCRRVGHRLGDTITDENGVVQPLLVFIGQAQSIEEVLDGAVCWLCYDRMSEVKARAVVNVLKTFKVKGLPIHRNPELRPKAEIEEPVPARILTQPSHTQVAVKTRSTKVVVQVQSRSKTRSGSRLKTGRSLRKELLAKRSEHQAKTERPSRIVSSLREQLSAKRKEFTDLPLKRQPKPRVESESVARHLPEHSFCEQNQASKAEDEIPASGMPSKQAAPVEAKGTGYIVHEREDGSKFVRTPEGVRELVLDGCGDKPVFVRPEDILETITWSKIQIPNKKDFEDITTREKLLAVLQEEDIVVMQNGNQVQDWVLFCTNDDELYTLVDGQGNAFQVFFCTDVFESKSNRVYRLRLDAEVTSFESLETTKGSTMAVLSTELSAGAEVVLH